MDGSAGGSGSGAGVSVGLARLAKALSVASVTCSSIMFLAFGNSLLQARHVTYAVLVVSVTINPVWLFLQPLWKWIGPASRFGMV